MELDPFVLSRIQFAANITFHILFPTITIGLGWFLLFFRVRYTQTGNMLLGARLQLLGKGVRADLRAWALSRA
jgi:cytochrome bd-type quinol oxidase subunit 1